MKNSGLLLAGLLMLACGRSYVHPEATTTEATAENTTTGQQEHQTLHDFEAETLEGEPFDFADLKGKRVLIVNTASECGYTPQYEQLQTLYEKYGGENFTIVGFPANDFGKQEPGNNEEIKAFCEKNYGVSFPMMAKISVKGDDMHPVYRWLTQKERNGRKTIKVSWNFNKFLVDENGEWVAYFPSKVDPLDEMITDFASGKAITPSP